MYKNINEQQEEAKTQERHCQKTDGAHVDPKLIGLPIDGYYWLSLV